VQPGGPGKGEKGKKNEKERFRIADYPRKKRESTREIGKGRETMGSKKSLIRCTEFQEILIGTGEGKLSEGKG